MKEEGSKPSESQVPNNTQNDESSMNVPNFIEQNMESTLVEVTSPTLHHPNSSSQGHQSDIKAETENLNDDSDGVDQPIPMSDDSSDHSSDDDELLLALQTAIYGDGGLNICGYCKKDFHSIDDLRAHLNAHKLDSVHSRRVPNYFGNPSRPTSIITPPLYPTNIPPLAPPHPYYYPYPTPPGTMAYNIPFNGSIGFRMGPTFQRPLLLPAPSFPYHFQHPNNVWANNPYLITPPVVPPFNQMMNAPSFEYRNGWLSNDLSLGGLYGSTSTTNDGAGSSTSNTIRGQIHGDLLVGRDEDNGKEEDDDVKEEDDGVKEEDDDSRLDLTLKL